MTTIQVQQAQINTVKVEIKTLSVNGKQVTLALFRQLLNENSWTRDYKLDKYVWRGIPWGTVNYHNRDCTDSHFHLVWQLGNELRTDIIDHYRNYSTDYEIQIWNMVTILPQLFIAV